MSAETKRFHIGDILTVTTDRLVTPGHIDGLYAILNWLTDDNLYTHQLIRAGDECTPFLREQFPDLAAVQVPEDLEGEEAVEAWLASVVAEHGSHREVPRAPAADHARIDPLLELSHMVGADKVIPVVVSPEVTR